MRENKGLEKLFEEEDKISDNSSDLPLFTKSSAVPANNMVNEIADLPDFYILADMLEYSIGKKLPLWSVGMMY